MDKGLIEEIKKKLESERGRLIEQLEEMTKEKSFDKDKIQAKWQEYGSKEEDSAVEVAEFQDNISLERRLETNLEKIEKALKKIEEDNYGVCENCENSIEDERLLVYPEAQHCLECHKKHKA